MNNNIIRTFQINGTQFTVFFGSLGDYQCDYFVQAIGRLNFERPIQGCDPNLFKSKSFVRYILNGLFMLIEDEKKYLFDHSQNGWTIKFNGNCIFIGDSEVLGIISGTKLLNDVLKAEKITELVTSESKEALSTLSEMLDNNVLDSQKLEEIKALAEQSDDERIKDMIRIVEKHFRNKSNSKESDININVIE